MAKKRRLYPRRKRRSPIRHNVKSHTRKQHPVDDYVRGQGSPSNQPRYRSKTYEEFKEQMPLDPKIRRVVQLLNEFGFETTGSCEGHEKGWTKCFVGFYARDKNKYRILKTALSDMIETGEISMQRSPYEEEGKMLKVYFKNFDERDRIITKLENRLSGLSKMKVKTI